jgi:hypothetical protein
VADGAVNGRLAELAAEGWSTRRLESADETTAARVRSESLAEVRRIAGLDERGTADELIARFLFEPGSVPPEQLWSAGVDPLELHRLELAFRAVRNRRARFGRRNGRARKGVIPTMRALDSQP